MRVVIVGAGPAGLSAATQLMENGDHEVTLLEQDPEYVGGLARTVTYNGFRFDLGGHRFFTKNSEIQKWWEKRLGEDFLRVKRLSRIYYKGRFFLYPLRPWNALSNLGPLKTLLCILSYLRRAVFPRKPERSFEDWVSNRFGDRLFRIFFKTYTEKVWGLSCDEISADWAAQRIMNFSLGQALKSAFRLRDSNVVKTLIEEFYYPRLGPGMLWERVRDDLLRLGCGFRMGERVTSLTREGNRVTAIETTSRSGERHIYEGDQFLSSMPLRDSVLLMTPPFDDVVRVAAKNLRYRDFIVVALIVESPDLFPDNWIYIHDPVVRVGRIQNFNNWSHDMVPEPGITCLGLEYFCSKGDSLWGLTDEELIDLAEKEITYLRLVGRGKIRDAQVVRVEKAYPVYTPDYRANLGVLREALDRLVNFQPIGRNGMHKYNNQDHSMLTGFLAARNLGGQSAFDLWCVNSDAEYLEDDRGEDRSGRLTPSRLRERGLEKQESEPAKSLPTGSVEGVRFTKGTVASHRARSERDTLGFTLLELLVTISVIAVIVAFLYPALAGARSRADSARCSINLRQIGIAVRMYAGDNEGLLPVVESSPRTRVRSARQQSRPSGELDSVLRVHVSQNREVFECPADAKKNPDVQGSSYEWNIAVNGRILHRIEDAAGTRLTQDVEGWHPKARKNAVFVDGHVGEVISGR